MVRGACECSFLRFDAILMKNRRSFDIHESERYQFNEYLCRSQFYRKQFIVSTGQWAHNRSHRLHAKQATYKKTKWICYDFYLSRKNNISPAAICGKKIDRKLDFMWHIWKTSKAPIFMAEMKRKLGTHSAHCCLQFCTVGGYILTKYTQREIVCGNGLYNSTAVGHYSR